MRTLAGVFAEHAFPDPPQSPRCRICGFTITLVTTVSKNGEPAVFLSYPLPANCGALR